MYDPNQAHATELPPNPFEGIDMFAPLEDLAIAEIRQRMLTVDQESEAVSPSLESRLLQFQLTLVESELDTLRQGRQELIRDDDRSVWLGQEMEALGNEPGLDKRSLEAGHVIGEYGTAGRWRLSQIDPTTLDSNTRNNMEARWSEAAGHTRTARIAMLNAEIAQLDVRAGLAKIRGEDTASFQAQRDALYSEKYKLNRPSYGAAIRYDNGTG